MPYQLVGISGEHKGRVWCLDETGLLVGRGTDCDVMIADQAVSRRHCRIALSDGGVRLEDLNSRHPALVNGLPVLSCELRARDEVAIGTQLFLVCVEGERGAAAAAPRPSRTASWAHARPLGEPAPPAPGGDDRPHTIADLVTLHEMARVLGRSGNSRDLLARVAECLQRQFAPRAIWVARLRQDGTLAFHGRGNDAGDPAADAPAGLMAACLERGEGLLAPREHRMGGEPVRALVLAAPVVFNDCPLGALAVETYPPAVYREADLHLLVLFAANLAPCVHAVEVTERMRRDFEQLRTAADSSLTIVGESRAIVHVRGEIKKAARSPLHILVCGETGTGKEIVARGIHAASGRRSKPLVVVNCAAIPRDLVESQLFGYAKGAFTGAEETRRGLLDEAHGGTLFLDEVGDLSLENQARVLRAIETGAYRPIGAEAESYADFRVVAATNMNLQDAIAAGVFRIDLYHRLNGYEIHIPPLRERPSDIPLLAMHFFELGKTLAKRPLEGISAEAMEYLRARPWPGNVRELRNVIIRGVSLAETRQLQLHDVMLENAPVAAPHEICEPLSLAAAEKQHIAAALRHCRGDVNATARLLEVSRSTLYRKLTEYGLQRLP